MRVGTLKGLDRQELGGRIGGCRDEGAGRRGEEVVCFVYWDVLHRELTLILRRRAGSAREGSPFGAGASSVSSTRTPASCPAALARGLVANVEEGEPLRHGIGPEHQGCRLTGGT